MIPTLPSSAPNQYTSSRQLIAGSDINAITAQLNSGNNGVTAGAGGGQAKATQLNNAVNIVTSVVTANDSVKLPNGIIGLEVWIQNADSTTGHSCQVYAYGVGTINNTDGAATGVALAESVTGATMYKCLNIDPTLGDIWVSK
jgi:hypothetical protein